MSMKFAGFMAAARDDRLLREEREAAEKAREQDYNYRKRLQDADWDRRMEMEGVKLFNEQREKDRLLGVAVDHVMATSGLPANMRPSVTAWVEAANGDALKVLDMIGSGALSPTGGGPVSYDGSGEGLRPLLDEANTKYGLPEGYLFTTAGIESSFNPNAKNPNSSAGGLFQVIDSTAADLGLTNKFSVDESTDAAARLATQNSAQLYQSLGRMPTAGELYLAHQQGAGGASKLLRNPNAKAVDLVGMDQVLLNVPSKMGGRSLSLSERRQIANSMTGQDFANLWINKYEARAKAYGYGGGAAPASTEVISARGENTTEPTSAVPAERTSTGATPSLRYIPESERAAKQKLAEDIDDFAEKVYQADTSKELIALQNSLEAKKGWLTSTPGGVDEYSRRATIIAEGLERIRKNEERAARSNADPLMFFPKNEFGMIEEAAAEPVYMQPDGTWKTASGRTVNLDTDGRAFSEEAALDYVKVFNKPFQAVRDLMTNATVAATSLAAYRRVVQEEGPAALNRYLRAGGAAVNELKMINDTIREMSQNGQPLTEDIQQQHLARLTQAARGATRREMALLRAAYGIAALMGSTGQALSNQELDMNLNSLGGDATSMATVMTLIDDTFRDVVVNSTETRRSLLMDSLPKNKDAQTWIESSNLTASYRESLADAFESTGDEGLIRQFNEMSAFIDNPDEPRSYVTQEEAEMGVGGKETSFMGDNPTDEANAAPDVIPPGYDSKEAFLSDPAVLEAAEAAGVTPQAMYEVLRDSMNEESDQ